MAYKLAEHVEPVQGAVDVVHHKWSHVGEADLHFKRASLILLTLFFISSKVPIFNFCDVSLLNHGISPSKDQNTLVACNESTDINVRFMKNIDYFPPGGVIHWVVALQINSLNCRNVSVTCLDLLFWNASSLPISADYVDNSSEWADSTLLSPEIQNRDRLRVILLWVVEFALSQNWPISLIISYKSMSKWVWLWICLGSKSTVGVALSPL